jgi:hypothetical protein
MRSLHHLLVLLEVHGVVALEGVAHAGHAVVGGEVVHLGEHLTLPIDPVAHPASHTLAGHHMLLDYRLNKTTCAALSP